MDFGTQVRQWRLDADLSLRQAAKGAGLDFTYLSKIEAGLVPPPPSEDKIRDLAVALGRRVDAEHLVRLARTTRVPNEVVKSALLRQPEVGALLRRIKERPLSSREVEVLRQLAHPEDSRP